MSTWIKAAAAEKCSCTESTFKVDAREVDHEVKKAGESRMTARLWLEQLQERKMVGGAVGVHTGGWIKTLVLFILSLRYLLDIKSELFSRQLNI